jgi:hypothetical protein
MGTGQSGMSLMGRIELVRLVTDGTIQVRIVVYGRT